MVNKMNILMDRVDNVVSGTDRGLLIVSDNQFLKKQIEQFLVAKKKMYRWFLGDVTLDALFELLNGEHILVFDGLHYNKRGVNGLLYRSVIEPVGQPSKIIFRKKETFFGGKIILFGTTIIKNPSVRKVFSIWME